MIQARPNVRLLDPRQGSHRRKRDPRGCGHQLQSGAEGSVGLLSQFWGRDANLRRNMTTSIRGWTNTASSRARTSSWRMREGKIIKLEVVLKVLDKMTGARLKSAFIRTCAAVGLDWRMELELKALPLPLARVNGKPSNSWKTCVPLWGPGTKYRHRVVVPARQPM
jgi:hypothetical protein